MRRQVKHFNRNRFLEIAYYIISFYFSSKRSLVRIVYCILLALRFDLIFVIALELIPNTLVFTICSVMTYLW